MTQVQTVGVDIGGGSVKAACLGPHASTSQSAKYRDPSRDELCGAIRQAVEALEVDQQSPVHVGLCVPGRQNETGSAVDLSFHVPGLQGWAFNELVAQAVGPNAKLAAVLSDAEAATRDAARRFPEAQRVLGLAIGTGVGASLLDNGRPLALGPHGVGHIGQLEINDKGESLESVVGVRAMQTRFGERIKRKLPALEATDHAILALSRAVRTCMLIYKPELVLLLGGVGLSFEPSLRILRQSVRAGLSEVVQPGWRIETGTTLHHAALGAARAAKAS